MLCTVTRINVFGFAGYRLNVSCPGSQQSEFTSWQGSTYNSWLIVDKSGNYECRRIQKDTTETYRVNVKLLGRLQAGHSLSFSLSHSLSLTHVLWLCLKVCIFLFFSCTDPTFSEKNCRFTGNTKKQIRALKKHKISNSNGQDVTILPLQGYLPNNSL